jgi:hypothetical protein
MSRPGQSEQARSAQRARELGIALEPGIAAFFGRPAMLVLAYDFSHLFTQAGDIAWWIKRSDRKNLHDSNHLYPTTDRQRFSDHRIINPLSHERAYLTRKTYQLVLY